MRKSISFGELDFKIVASMNEARGKQDSETPFQICILGDFSGRRNRAIYNLASTITEGRPIEVDRDNIETVMKKLGVDLHIPLAGIAHPPVPIQFKELDDFHPDQLYSRLDVFKVLKDTRKRLNDPREFEMAKKEIRGWVKIGTASEDTEQGAEKLAAPPAPSQTPDDGILDRILEASNGRIPDAETLADPSGWNAFLHKIVAPYLVPGPDPHQEMLVAAVDVSISTLMKTILHDPDFQALEAAWRALRFLLYRAETGEKLKIYVLDLSKDELTEDLHTSDNLQASKIYRLLVDQAREIPGGEPWGLLAGNYTFDKTRRDIECLGRMARIAGIAGAPFVSAAHVHFLGCESLAETPDPDAWIRPTDKEDNAAWEALRRLAEAPYLGLALPRFLLRLPYGAETEPVDSFDFEEMGGTSAHEKYLWGNPVCACVLLLAQAFSHNGWGLRPGMIQEIEGLPLHVYKEDTETKTKPCAEVVLTEKAVEEILSFGLMPLLSFKDRDRIRLARFQSVSDPARNLAGQWHH
jgi:type VI secretion system protein ImpC